VALVALAVIVPPAPRASSRGATDQRGAQTSRADSEWKTVDVAHRVAQARAKSDTVAFVSENWVGVVRAETVASTMAPIDVRTLDLRQQRKHCLDPLVRGRNSAHCACVGHAWHALHVTNRGHQ
jgi:hypothetical protein